MIIFRNKYLVITFLTAVNVLLFSSFLFANTKEYKNILSHKDRKVYSEIFKIQKLPIKNKKSKEWKRVDKLINKLDNKILLGNVYAERFLHPTGWRS